MTEAITVNPLPTITVSGSTTVCNGGSVTQTLSGATSYSLNGSSTTTNVLMLNPTSTTTYSIMGVDNNGCAGSATTTVNVRALPTVSLSTTSATICVGESATITASGASSYVWSGVSGTSASVVVTPTITTTYSITGTNSSSCSASAQLVQNVSICTSINQWSKAGAEYNLYPNPASSFIVIDNVNSDKNEIRIVNALGAVVISEKNYSSSRNIDVSGLAKGIYIVQIYSDNKTCLKKLIIE
jgi:hypothetical protein